MIDEKIKLPHNMILEDRRSLSVSGVEDVDSYDENTVVLFTQLGELTIRGKNLHISKLNVDTGELSMDGEIYAIVYSEEAQKKQGGIFSKLLR